MTLKAITQDTVCLQKEKDRIVGGKEKLYLKKVGEDCFEAVEQGEEQEIPLIIRAQSLINRLLDDGIYTRAEFIEQGQCNGFSRATIDRAVDNLINAGKLKRIKRGIYSRAKNPIREDPRGVGEHCSPLLKAYKGGVEKSDKCLE